jgi:hypothetical protein
MGESLALLFVVELLPPANKQFSSVTHIVSASKKMHAATISLH